MLNVFDNFVLFVCYGKCQELWCLDLLNGDLVRSNKEFPMNALHKMHMISTSDNYGHFIIASIENAWVQQVRDNGEVFYF